MAEIEITGKQIGQLDALAAIDGSEKIPVETADGNGHVTTQQMREYAQPDLSGYATKDEIPSVEGLLSESKAAETYQPIGNYATKEEIEGIGGVGQPGEGENAEVFNDYTGNKATKIYSHAEGGGTTASGIASHAEGGSTEATNSFEHAEGFYNRSNRGDTDAERTRHSVGIGTSGADRKNAFEIMANGDAYLCGVGGYDGTNALSEQAKTLQEVVGGIPDTSQLATKEELAGKVGGTGVSAIEVVTELPAEPQDGVMYVVMG